VRRWVTNTKCCISGNTSTPVRGESVCLELCAKIIKPKQGLLASLVSRNMHKNSNIVSCFQAYPTLKKRPLSAIWKKSISPNTLCLIIVAHYYQASECFWKLVFPLSVNHQNQSMNRNRLLAEGLWLSMSCQTAYLDALG